MGLGETIELARLLVRYALEVEEDEGRRDDMLRDARAVLDRMWNVWGLGKDTEDLNDIPF